MSSSKGTLAVAMVAIMVLSGCAAPEQAPEPVSGWTEATLVYAPANDTDKDRVVVEVQPATQVKDRGGSVVDAYLVTLRGGFWSHDLALDADFSIVRLKDPCLQTGGSSCRHAYLSWEGAGALPPFGLGLRSRVDDGLLHFEHGGRAVSAVVQESEDANGNVRLKVGSAGLHVPRSWSTAQGSYVYAGSDFFPQRAQMMGPRGALMDYVLVSSTLGDPLVPIPPPVPVTPPFAPGPPDDGVPVAANRSPTQDDVTYGDAYKALLDASEEATELDQKSACLVRQKADPVPGNSVTDVAVPSSQVAYDFDLLANGTRYEFTIERYTRAGHHEWVFRGSEREQTELSCPPADVVGRPRVPLDPFVEYVQDLDWKTKGPPSITYSALNLQGLQPGVGTWHKWYARWLPAEPGPVAGMDFTYGFNVDARTGLLTSLTAHPDDVGAWERSA